MNIQLRACAPIGIKLAAVVVAFNVLAQPTEARADIYEDDFIRCLVAKSTQADRDTFVRWMFAAMSANAKISDLSTVTTEQRDQATRAVGGLMQRLIFVDCRAEAVAAVRYGGATAFAKGFETFGRVAMGDLMADPAVGRSIDGVSEFIDKTSMEEFAREVGAPSAGGNNQ